ncbi:tryptophan--tRNA ligase [Salibacter halophilus]|uniref:Tryptophan--tRNA ligase n=1 Tax=Salibacter halophilus TaxID=1803916 RepID=A0A6N6M667_9FLAO|nr:tryptophan--tRNA ligase [Salibacter halophilus]KAB1063752.1 tryptophan--tRNA ligase [Salibacter halophilus]
MARILTGIQATGVPHLGNILGAIEPAINLANDPKNESLLFIANLHTLTSIKEPEVIRENTYAVAAAWLALGLNTERTIFYRQSDIPEVTEMTWYLNCFTPFPMLANAHSFKDKSDRLSDVNAGLFDYPVLMACDILMYDADIVPVGKDQKQHLEMTRDIAGSINHNLGKETLKQPEASFDENVMIVPGIDGEKMSKSYGNTINLFQTDKKLRKNVMKIVTDTTPLEKPKNPDTCNVFKIYKLVASDEEVATMRKNYEAGGYGYGHAKQELYEKLRDRYSEPRERFQHLMDNKHEIDQELEKGAKRAREIGRPVLSRLRKELGY